jgi:hypothetical protein
MPGTPRICGAQGRYASGVNGCCSCTPLVLLNNNLQPTDRIRMTRNLRRAEGHLVAEPSSVMQCLPKVLTEMNVQLSNVRSDFSGVSGLKIIGAIFGRRA